MRMAVIVAALLLVAPAGAQEAGWHYSPLPGEGDRAALGCASGSTAETYACIAVRCEDDFSTGLHLYTSRSEGDDSGDWLVDIDEDTFPVSAQTEPGPYGARIIGDITALRDGLEQGAAAYLQPKAGAPLPLAIIPLSGSLASTTRALAYCAPRVPAAEPNAATGVELPTNKEN